MKKWLLSGFAFVMVLAMMIGVVGTASAETPGATPTPGAGRGMGMGVGVGMGAGFGFRGLPDAVVNALGLAEDQIATQRQAGKSLVEIAKNAPKPMDEATLVNAILAEHQKAIDARVASGAITKDQAATMIERMKTQVQTMEERTTVGPNTNGQAGQGMGAARRGNGSGVGPMMQNGTCPYGNQTPARAQ
jgi:ribosomal protein S20